MRLEDLQGRRIGRYEITALLGRGGMAVVYRAHDTVLRRDVALKVLYPQYTNDATLIERFKREAILAGALDHPHIVPIYDVGEADGLVYIAMKLLSGRSLDELLRMRERLSVGEVLPIVAQIAAALDFAHARGIVHRDIKAGNILLEVRDDGPWAILTDFGIAKSLDAPGMTGSGVLLGTPDYMAPEQIEGAQVVDGRADIYALGVLVFRCLTGRRPFQGGTDQVLLGHLEGRVPDLSQFDATLPMALDAVIHTATARQPADRYASAGAFARALTAACLTDAPTPPPAKRRGAEAKVVVPRVAIGRRGDRALSGGEVTRTGDAAPIAVRPALMTATPRAPVPPPQRSSGMGLAMLTVVLVVLIGGGGLLLAQGFQQRVGGDRGGEGATIAVPSVPASVMPDVRATEPPSTTPTSTTEPTQLAASAQPTRPPRRATPTPRVSMVPTMSTPLATLTTPFSTDVPTPAETALVNPTVTPSPTPTMTIRATSTMTPSPTPTMTPVLCSVTMINGFAKLWNEQQAVHEQLGCPLLPERAGRIAEQPFEHGSMLWYEPDEVIYVLFGFNGGTWQVFDQRSLRARPTPEATATPPSGFFAPVGGFGLVWNVGSALQDALGWGTAVEAGPFSGALQPFENGVMVFSPQGLGRGKTIYVLYKDRSFKRFDDTFVDGR